MCQRQTISPAFKFTPGPRPDGWFPTLRGRLPDGSELSFGRSRPARRVTFLERPSKVTKRRPWIPCRLALLRRVPSAGQMNAGRARTHCVQTTRPADRHSSIRLRRRRHGELAVGGQNQTRSECWMIHIRKTAEACSSLRGPKWMGPANGGQGCGGVGMSVPAAEANDHALREEKGAFAAFCRRTKGRRRRGTRPPGSGFRRGKFRPPAGPARRRALLPAGRHGSQGL